jgi:hypothetical protein
MQGDVNRLPGLVSATRRKGVKFTSAVIVGSLIGRTKGSPSWRWVIREVRYGLLANTTDISSAVV